MKKESPASTSWYINEVFELEQMAGEDKRIRKSIMAGSEKVATVEEFVGGDQVAQTFHHSDHLGSSSVDTDEAGDVRSLTDYYAYGEVRFSTAAEDPLSDGDYDNPYKFTGKELDDETGLYYYEARYYNAAIGRFVSIDPWGGDLSDPQSLNKYAYVSNNPVKYVDPSGEEWQWYDYVNAGMATYGFANGVKNRMDQLKNAVLNPVDTVVSAYNGFIDNASYLYDYAQDHTAGEFFNDLSEGIQIAAADFADSSYYEKGEILGGVGFDVAVTVLAGGVVKTVKGGKLPDLPEKPDWLVFKNLTDDIDNNWYGSTFGDSTKSFDWHYDKHVLGEGYNVSKEKYLQDAQDFFEANKDIGTNVTLNDGSAGIRIDKGDGNGGGFFTTDGTPTSFWYN